MSAAPTVEAPEQRAIALAAGTRERRERLAGPHREVLAAVDWDRLAAALAQMRLLPTLGPRIVAVGEGRAPAPFAAAVEAAVLAAQRQDVLLWLASDRVEALLAERGIRAARLKGPALGEAIFGEPGRRISGDVDVLVEPERLRVAARAIGELGYGEASDPLVVAGKPILHLALDHREGVLPPVELHWRVHWYETRFAAERLLPPGPGRADWRPEPVDELAALLLFYARDGYTGLRQAADLAAWWDRFGECVRPADLAALTGRYPQLREALLTSLVIAERVVGLPAGRLGVDRSALGRRARLAARLADPRPYASEAQLFAEISLIDGLLAPTEALPAYFRRQVAPSRELLRNRAAKSRGGRLASPLGYGIRVLGRYALALGRLARIPFATRARFSPPAADVSPSPGR
jgi:Uncharacterised nucleotidyltransferase